MSESFVDLTSKLSMSGDSNSESGSDSDVSFVDDLKTPILQNQKKLEAVPAEDFPKAKIIEGHRVEQICQTLCETLPELHKVLPDFLTLLPDLSHVLFELKPLVADLQTAFSILNEKIPELMKVLPDPTAQNETVEDQEPVSLPPSSPSGLSIVLKMVQQLRLEVDVMRTTGDDKRAEKKEIKHLWRTVEKLQNEQTDLKSQLSQPVHFALISGKLIVESILGEWQMVSSNNLDEYLRVNVSNYTERVFWKYGNRCFERNKQMMTVYGRLDGNPFERGTHKLGRWEECDDGTDMVIYVDGEKLIMLGAVRKTGELIWRLEHSITDGKLRIEARRNQCACERFYEKI
ncbi:unnamed protein product [Caenorhabditis sp. 36 PRJEB53466]|nr:unnamed protein product [Caenorhabditis sp. 36 PRJEB53466]